ncbi:MAG: class I SAM-dependent methyltransferase [bacterium]
MKKDVHTFNFKSEYFKTDIDNNRYVFESEQDWVDRPAWIKINDINDKLPRFLSIETSNCGEIIYKAFGNYYFPLDYKNTEEKRFMNGVAKDYDMMVSKDFNIPMAKALLEKLNINQISKDMNILDLGCGTGILSRILFDKGYMNLELVDFSSEMLRSAKAKFKDDKIIFNCMDLTETFPNNKYDLVASVMLFNSFNEKITDKIITNIFNHLNPGGIIAIMEDKQKKAYTKYFKTIFSDIVDVGLRKKYIYIGKK